MSKTEVCCVSRERAYLDRIAGESEGLTEEVNDCSRLIVANECGLEARSNGSLRRNFRSRTGSPVWLTNKIKKSSQNVTVESIGRASSIIES